MFYLQEEHSNTMVYFMSTIQLESNNRLSIVIIKHRIIHEKPFIFIYPALYVLEYYFVNAYICLCLIHNTLNFISNSKVILFLFKKKEHIENTIFVKRYFFKKLNQKCFKKTSTISSLQFKETFVFIRRKYEILKCCCWLGVYG